MLLNANQLIKGQWKILSLIGQGAFGETYIAEDIINRTKVAIKVEPTAQKKQVLKIEVAVLKKLQGKNHLCNFLGCGKLSNCNYIVMQLLGHNLSELRRGQTNHRFNVPTASLLAMDMLNAIRIIHQGGYLHRDIKPSNFAVGLEDSPSLRRPEVFIIDFGLSRKYVNQDGSLKKARSFAGFRGTARYASVYSHLAQDLGRRDDLWSLFYTIVEFLKGSLPWRKEKDRDKIGRMKQELTNPSLVLGLPEEMLLMMNYLHSLNFEDAPNYDYLNGLLISMIKNANEQHSFTREWLNAFPLPFKDLINAPPPDNSDETISAKIPPCKAPALSSSRTQTVAFSSQPLQDDFGDLDDDYDPFGPQKKILPINVVFEESNAPISKSSIKKKYKKRKMGNHRQSPEVVPSINFNSSPTNHLEETFRPLSKSRRNTVHRFPIKSKIESKIPVKRYSRSDGNLARMKRSKEFQVPLSLVQYEEVVETDHSIESVFKTAEEDSTYEPRKRRIKDSKSKI